MNLILWKEILHDELVQLKEEGRFTMDLEREAEQLDHDNLKQVELFCRKLYGEMVRGLLPARDPEFPYVEPNGWEEIVSQSPGASRTAVQLAGEDAFDKVYGAWLGRSVGCLLGKPVEGWPRATIRRLLQENGAYPLNQYFSLRCEPQDVEQWMSDQYVQNAIEYCKAMPRDDDMDYTILALKILETFGSDFKTEDVGTMWLYYLPPFMTYTAERAAYLNLCTGVPVTEAAVYLNPYREWIGAQIRTDLYGYINPGNPLRAAEMAYRDAALSHVGNGVYGALFISAMNAAAYVENDIEAVIRAGLSVIPNNSRLYEAIEWTLDEAKRESDWEKAGDRLMEKFGFYHRVHTINNAAIVALALLYGNRDLEKTVTIAVMMGLDTDCNGASAGSIVGLMNGASALPDKWVKPLHDQIESYLAGEGTASISRLASRTLKHFSQEEDK